MKTPFSKQWLTAALCVLALGTTAARAEHDTFGVGTGRNGALVVSGSGTSVNAYAPVTAALTTGSTSIPIGACVGGLPCFSAGDLVMVYQTTGLVPAPASGAQTPVELGNEQVGRWELARVTSVTATTLELRAALIHAYAANVTQVIRVPEFTTVTLAAGRSITAPAWNGSTGGIVAFLATGLVSNNGLISTSDVGFRGGQYLNDTTGAKGCTELDDTPPEGAQKGEGIGNQRYGSTQGGRGNVANGAGGGVCFKAGGGGGGHGGAGGLGGRSAAVAIDGSREVGGLGGAALTYPTRTQLVFGGGGGAGHGSDGTGVAGGRGGGTVFIRANQLTGTGIITASGGSPVANSGSDGSSGGGAGGSIYLRFVRTADCGSVSATGGIGGNTNAPQVGPGGGGGGGQVLFQAAGGTCNIIATGANPGIQQEIAAGTYGAREGGPGITTVIPGGFVIPSPPTVLTPANGSSTNNPRPPITGTSVAGAVVIIYVDGNEVGRVTAVANGTYSFTPPTDLSDGPHTVQAVAEVEAVRSETSPPNAFTVDTSVPDTTIVSGPPDRIREQNVTFTFSSTEPAATYECSLDGADFTACPSPVTFTTLAVGPHTLLVRARDAAGNVDPSPATQTFRVTDADYDLLGSGCSTTGRDSSLVLLSLGALAALRRRGSRRRKASKESRVVTGLTPGASTHPRGCAAR